MREKDLSRFRRLKKNYVRHRCLSDFWFFMEFLLQNPVLFEKLHRELCDFVCDWSGRRKKLVLLPRGHVKSNIITIGYTLWCVLRDQDVRILLNSHKDKDAKKFLRTIKSYILGDRFKHFFPEIRPQMSRGKEKVWNDEMILVVRETTATENTVEIGSISSQITGRHYSGVINDDLVTINNVSTADQRYKTQEMHELSQNLLDPGSWEIVTGTRYHFADEYGRILEEDVEKKQYDTMILPVLYDITKIHDYISGYAKWERSHDFEHLLYPTRYTLDRTDYVDPGDDDTKNRKSLISLYLDQGPKSFANQMMLEPFDPSTQEMHDGMLKEWDKVPEEGFGIDDTHKITYYRACDLSSPTPSKYEKSYTAIGTVAVTPECDIIITDIYWGNFGGPDIIEELIMGQLKHPDKIPKYVTMEQGPYERSVKPFLFRAMREREVRVPIRPMSNIQHQRSKAEHIDGLVKWVATGKVGYERGCRNINILKEEMNKYPAFDRKDCLDMLAQIPLLCFRRGSERFLQEPKQVPMELSKEQKLFQALNAPTVRFANLERQLLGGSRKRLGADKVLKI